MLLSSSTMSDAPPPSPGASSHHRGDSHHGHKHHSKRPQGSRHGSDWIAKLHKRHDARHHAPRERDEEQEAPLLAQSTDDQREHDDNDDQTRASYSLWTPFILVANAVQQVAEYAVSAAKQGGQKMIQAAKSASEMTARGARRTGHAVKENPKRGMSGVIVLLLLLLIALASLFGLHLESEKQNTICTTFSCIRVADNLLRNLNIQLGSGNSVSANDNIHVQAVDPCTNFDKFVCGSFEQHHDFRDDQGHIDASMLPLLHQS